MKKILIANRGEIAVRIIRTCHEMGIQTVAVYSDVDRQSPHVLMSTEAYPIGPAPSTESYLRIDKLIEAAKVSGAEGLHPGYGFLSENPKFAQAVIDAGLIWIGPPIDAMINLGDKVKARQTAKNAHVPVSPGSESEVTDEKVAKKIASSIGYPILLKAVGGGGGKGMRIVNKPAELSSSLKRAMSEAGASFSDSRIFIEKYLSNPRHIEIQFMADAHGNVAAFTERECSVQRRYQKLIEESPSSFISRSLWKKMAECARRIVTESGYVGAGTVEFLVDENKNFYFLEMNTRLQVEHPVTEMICGLDIVREQIRVASGKKLSLDEEYIGHRGHAIECRIYAENGFDNFIPSTGTIQELHLPDGFGIRFDHGIRMGQEITPYYDPLLGKLVAWGNSRKDSLNRMKRALKECHIVGIETTIPFCIAIISNRQFQTGNYNTHFIEKSFDELLRFKQENMGIERELACAVAGIHTTNMKPDTTISDRKTTEASLWKSIGRKEELS